MAKLSTKDRDAIGQRYRAMPITLSQSECARQLNVSQSTLRGWIEKFGWERDLAPEVKRRTNIAVQKAMLGAPLNEPLDDESAAVTERVAINVAIITAQQDMLTSFSSSVECLLGQFSSQVKGNMVAVPDDESDTGYRLVPKKLGDSTSEARSIMQTMSQLFEEQRKVYGLSDGNDNEMSVDEFLRELAEEAQKASAEDAPTDE